MSRLERRFNTILQRTGKLIDRFVLYREKGMLMDLPVVSGRTIADGGGEYHPPVQAQPVTGQTRSTPSLHSTHAPYIKLKSPPPNRSGYRSWYDPSESVICINREHAEFLVSQREHRRCLRYLFSIWAKESLLQEFGSDAERVADELVGVLAEAEPLLS